MAWTVRARIKEINKAIEGIHESLKEVVGRFENVQQQVDQLRAEVDNLQAGPEAAHATGAVDAEFEELLDRAAGVAYAKISCHRDTWDFLVTETAADRGGHFRLPAVVRADDDYLVDVDISGRALVAILEALRVTRSGAQVRPGTRHMAGIVYQRIANALKRLDPDDVPGAAVTEAGRPQVIRVVIDDRLPANTAG